nr:CehA/McbA family metallohydrolase [Rhodopirellula sp. JC639]
MLGAAVPLVICAQEASDHGRLVETRPTDPAGTRLYPFTGRVVDSKSGQPVQCRVHLQDASGKWYLVQSDGGNAVHYERDLAHLPNSPEVHTTLSADPFVVDLPNGDYTLRVERGKEYFPYVGTFSIANRSRSQTIRLQRWINLAKRGWYSGDTHVHRTVGELPNIMLAEDLNVAFPLTYWVQRSDTVPTADEHEASYDRLIHVDSNHVIYPRNTEYEIFEVHGKRQTLGAVLILNHQQPLKLGAPPMGNIATEARRQGALMDLDKHSWPWSLMIIPVMEVDLFELSNNHVWQTEFGFRDWAIDTISPHMGLQQDDAGLTEWGWIDYGFQTYYQLINCGFRMRVTAGNASGVHPVALGFGRVYVRLTDGFDYDSWMDGLNAGRSFVSTGPMLDLRFNGGDAGQQFQVTRVEDARVQITGTAESRRPIRTIEIVVNGDVAQTIHPRNQQTALGGFRSSIDVTVEREGSFWTAVRCFEEHPTGRVRFAHTNPVYVDLEGNEVRPRKEAIDYFIDRLETECRNLDGVLTAESMAEYRRAVEFYRRIRQDAKPESTIEP